MYNAVNWLTMGAADAVSGAIAPEEPLSLQHWMDSYATVMLGYGAWKSGKAAGGTQQDVMNFGGNIKVTKNQNSVTKIHTAEDINQIMKETMGYEAPYKPNTIVTEFELTTNKTFVRVYNKINSRQQGGWIMDMDEIKGLSPKEIQNKFALPYEPVYICDVYLESGVKLRYGEVNPLFGFDGGGMQYDLLLNEKNVGNFVNERLIGE